MSLFKEIHKDSLASVKELLSELVPDHPVAVAVSGGPDSMALCWLLSQNAESKNGLSIHALTVDHGLRPDSIDEAGQVGQWLQGWPHVSHSILTRDTSGLKSTRIMESAREDRYALLASYCHEHGIKKLYVAHHLDDQAETFLFRLAKGSGLNGLAGIQPVRAYDRTLDLVRPFLDLPKAQLIEVCDDNDVPYVTDPSNDDSAYARVRLRKAHDVLEEEGLSSKRLAVTAARLLRARKALDHYTEHLWQEAIQQHVDDGLVFDFSLVQKEPAETRFRLMALALETLFPDSDYGPRMEKLEKLEQRIFGDKDFTAATLGGCVFRCNRKKQELLIEKEKKSEENTEENM